MDKSIFKINFYLFALLSLINLIFFCFIELTPDSYFEINSNGIYSGFVSYYFSTILSGVYYWTGLWVVPVLCCMIFFRYSISQKRPFTLKDFIVIILFSNISILFLFLFIPQGLGVGLMTWLTQVISPSMSFLLLFFLCISYFFLITPKNFLIQTIKRLEAFASFENIEKLKINFLAPKAILSSSKEILLKEVKKNFEKSKALVVTNTSPRTNSDTQDEVLNPVASDFDHNPDDISADLKSDVSVNRQNINTEDQFFEIEDLIDCISPKAQGKHTSDPDNSYFQTICRSIEHKLDQFNINAKVINVLKGPVVDTFELELGSGVKVTGVTNRTDDLSLALMGAPIRMVYPMKGKSTIGIEVPRNPRDVIYLDEVLKSKEFNNSNFKLPVAMGKDAYGDPAVIDLASTPHLLVAGTTGAGKSVFVNTLLVSLIIKFSPKKLRLIMLDPKQLELALYQNLPHLVMPVVTDPQIASAALLWAIDEMERRYSLLKDFSVKNIDGFNKKIQGLDRVQKSGIAKYYADADIENFELPYIVIVVDEFADLMLSKSGKGIETSISRLAAKARASGIHIVLATQRPSTDIITGVIKANFPTRVSFRVFTNIDSRVILDGVGAEKLLGKGDMLFKQGIDILRMHSAFVNEEEIEALVGKLSRLPSQYDAAAMEYIENSGGTGTSEDGVEYSDEQLGSKDEKYDEAVKCVAMHRVASASFLQRRLGVGYNRAANLIEEMERQGVVGPAQGSKPRKVLISSNFDSNS